MAKILVLEDDPDLLFTMTCALENEGHHVNGVATLKDAMRFLRFQKPDLLILDYMISEQNSLHIADFALYSNPNVPVIYVTGSSMFTDGQLFNMVRNIAWVLHKPVKMSELTEIAQYSLDRRDDQPMPMSMHAG